MALRDCPECRQPVSSAAVACPHCGHPLQRPQRRGVRRELLLVLVIVAVFAMFYGQEDPDSKHTPTTHCDVTTAERLVQQAITGGILHRIESQTPVSRVYILAPWTRLTIDEKRGLDGMLKCTVTHGTPNDQTIVVYHDGHTGKELATSNAYGFTVE